jgi:hypothetical protein
MHLGWARDPSQQLPLDRTLAAAVQRAAQSTLAPVDGLAPILQRARPKRTRKTRKPGSYARLNIRKGGNPTISGISNWPPRPVSNVRGKQGHHLTAFVMFEDAMLAAVKDKPLAGAVADISVYLRHIRNLPGMRRGRVQHINNAIDANLQILGNNAIAPAEVSQVIVNTLAIRNQVPGSAENRPTGGGRDEAGSSLILRTIGQELLTGNGVLPAIFNPVTVADQARLAIWHLLDWDPDPSTAHQAVADHIVTHFRDMELAYHPVPDWLAANRYLLFDYLIAHRQGPAMPLKQLSGPAITAIRAIVTHDL